MDCLTRRTRRSRRASSRRGPAASSAWLSLPFDLLKSRLQDAKAGASLARTAGDVLAKEGPLAFWTGFAAYYSRCAPHAMIILLTIDEVKAKYKAYFQL